MIKAIIVDDEPLARQSVILALNDIGGVQIIAECENGFEAVKTIREFKPDLVFLDIQMPKLSGFDVIELMGQEMPPVIFITAYDEFAVKAFDANAVDYLLKPVNPTRLQQALDKISAKPSASLKKIDNLMKSRGESGKSLERLLIRDGAEVHILNVNDIVFIQAHGDYIKIHTRERYFIKMERISNLHQRLPGNIFKRVHRSYLININCLKKIEPYSKDDKLAILSTGQQIPISRTGYQEIRKIL
ncbi:MAG: response regulator [Calditrichaceae bacterium]|nr:response regulator [Calditrichaceae bacterium]